MKVAKKMSKSRAWRVLVVILPTAFILMEIIGYSQRNNSSVDSQAFTKTFVFTARHGRNVSKIYSDNDPVKRDPVEDSDHTIQFKKRLPSCLIIGAKKSGTRALCEFLGIHPKIKTVCTEEHFFDYDSNYNKGIEYYLNHMPKSYPDEITIEKSAGYFITKGVRKRIHAFNSSIKLIVILRHPVKRMISDYWHERRVKENRGSSRAKVKFEDLAFDKTGGIRLDYKPLIVSMYYIHIKLYLHFFPRHQIHVVDGENFVVNPVEEIAKVETFLGLNHSITKDKVYFDKVKGYFCHRKSGENVCLKQSKGHTHPPIGEEYYQKLGIFFEPYNINLYKLLGQIFNW